MGSVFRERIWPSKDAGQSYLCHRVTSGVPQSSPDPASIRGGDVLPSCDCPQGQEGEKSEERWPAMVFCSSHQPSLPLRWKRAFSARWGLGERTAPVSAGSRKNLAPNQGGFGGDVPLSGWCQPLVRLEGSQRLFGKRAMNWLCIWGGFQLRLCLCWLPLLCSHSFTTLKSDPVYLADLTAPCQPCFWGFFSSFSHLFIACQCICCSPKLRNLEWVKPGCHSLPPFFSCIL